MANKGRAAFAKRQKEIARQERAKQKAARKIERKEAKARGEILDDDLGEPLTAPAGHGEDAEDDEEAGGEDSGSHSA
jgi:hypothetical protein